MNSNDLRIKVVRLMGEARSLLESRSDAWSQEDENHYNALIDESNKLRQQAERLEAAEKFEREAATIDEKAVKPQGSEARYDGPSHGTAEYRSAWAAWANGQKSLAEVRALAADSNVSGGYLLAPLQMVQGLLKAVDNATYIRQWANVQQVMGAAEGLGAVSLDNDPADPAWTSELNIGTEDSTMTFGKRELIPHPLAKYIKVSRKLLRKVPSVEGLLMQRFAYKFGVVMENAYLNGTGVGSPLGVMVASNSGVSTSRDVSTGNTATTITYDGLKNAKYTLKQQYHGRARWLFHRDAIKMLAKIKDGDGRYMWEDQVRAGEPDMLLGMPVFMSEYMPNTFTTLLYVGILGDWSAGYMIADDLNLEMQRLEELYAATNQVGFIARYEGDGMPVLEEAFVRVKLA